jgi:hypothetical protein
MLDRMREFLYGLTGYEFEIHAVAVRGSLESLFMAITFGDLVGVPIIPQYYALRLLPFVVPSVATWKRRVLRERELSDNPEFDLHGL